MQLGRWSHDTMGVGEVHGGALFGQGPLLQEQAQCTSLQRKSQSINQPINHPMCAPKA